MSCRLQVACKPSFNSTHLSFTLLSDIMDFCPGDIFATAFVTTVKDDSFHYTLSIMLDKNLAMKIHAKEQFPGHFVFEAAKQSVRTSRTLCTALLIGNLGNNPVEDVVEICKNIPLTLPDCDKEVDERFRCRVFLKQCIRGLDKAGIINCSDADAVVNGELKTYAKQRGPGISDGSGTYVIKKSKISA